MVETGSRYRIVGKHVAVVHLEGNYSIRESLLLVRDCLYDARMALPANLLVDVRKSTTSRSQEQLQQIAYALSAWSAKIRQIAIVTESKLYYGLARVLMAFMEDGEIHLEISYDYEGTLHRLMADEFPQDDIIEDSRN